MQLSRKKSSFKISESQQNSRREKTSTKQDSNIVKNFTSKKKETKELTLERTLGTSFPSNHSNSNPSNPERLNYPLRITSRLTSGVNFQKKLSSNDTSTTSNIIRDFSKKIENKNMAAKSPTPRQIGHISTTRDYSKGRGYNLTKNQMHHARDARANNTSYIGENIECLRNNMLTNLTKDNLDISSIHNSSITGTKTQSNLNLNTMDKVNHKIGQTISERRYSNNYLKKLDGNDKKEVKKPTSIKNFFDIGNVGDENEISNSDENNSIHHGECLNNEAKSLFMSLNKHQCTIKEQEDRIMELEKENDELNRKLNNAR